MDLAGHLFVISKDPKQKWKPSYLTRYFIIHETPWMHFNIVLHNRRPIQANIRNDSFIMTMEHRSSGLIQTPSNLSNISCSPSNTFEVASRDIIKSLLLYLWCCLKCNFDIIVIRRQTGLWYLKLQHAITCGTNHSLDMLRVRSTYRILLFSFIKYIIMVDTFQ